MSRRRLRRSALSRWSTKTASVVSTARTRWGSRGGPPPGPGQARIARCGTDGPLAARHRSNGRPVGAQRAGQRGGHRGAVHPSTAGSARRGARAAHPGRVGLAGPPEHAARDVVEVPRQRRQQPGVGDHGGPTWRCGPGGPARSRMLALQDEVVAVAAEGVSIDVADRLRWDQLLAGQPVDRRTSI